jgi:hypothetical protein
MGEPDDSRSCQTTDWPIRSRSDSLIIFFSLLPDFGPVLLLTGVSGLLTPSTDRIDMQDLSLPVLVGWDKSTEPGEWTRRSRRSRAFT